MANTLTQPKSVAPAAFEQDLIKMDQGVQTLLPANTSLTINGVATKQPVIDTTLQGWITTFKAVDTAKAQYQTAVAARLAITAAAKAYYKALKAVIKSYFGPQSAQLAGFGITGDKPVAQTAQQKLVASAKRMQTRAVRGTTSKKKKAAITVVGNPPVLVPSTGAQQISPPPVNVGGINTPSSSPSTTVTSTTTVSTPASTAAAATPTTAPAGSGAAGGTSTTGGSTPAAS